jgi:hypothetical protein
VSRVGDSLTIFRAGHPGGRRCSSLLEEAYDEAVARGACEADALTAAGAHISDWPALAREVSWSRRLTQPVLDRIGHRAGDAAAGGDRRAGLLARVLEHWRLATRVHRHRGYFTFATTTPALLLGVGGVFGLVAHLAESRRREFGVRIALGATSRDVVWRGARAALMPVAAGVAIGPRDPRRHPAP